VGQRKCVPIFVLHINYQYASSFSLLGRYHDNKCDRRKSTWNRPLRARFQVIVTNRWCSANVSLSLSYTLITNMRHLSQSWNFAPLPWQQQVRPSQINLYRFTFSVVARHQNSTLLIFIKFPFFGLKINNCKIYYHGFALLFEIKQNNEQSPQIDSDHKIRFTPGTL
jgi:hypothetical protein